MAVWQFDLDFEHAEDGRTLSAASPVRLMGLLSQSVGPSQTMMREWRYFGDRYGNRVDVVMEPDGSSQVQARLDARADETDGFIRKVCAGAAATGCVLVCEELGITLDPEPNDIRTSLQRSAAWRYALDPGSFRP